MLKLQKRGCFIRVRAANFNKGYFYEPTILIILDTSQYEGNLFSVQYSFKNFDEAKRANDNDLVYSYVYTTDSKS